MYIAKRKNFQFFALSIILLYSLINIITLIHHEPWRDEAQAWLIARDLKLPSIFRQASYEGTPALWHVILAPLAKAGLPYISMSIIHLIIAITAITIFLLYAPFSKITKALFIFSYYMAFEYSIIARNYNTSILLLFLIAAFYNQRFKYPLQYSLLVFLLFNTNVHSISIAVSLSILFIWEFFKKEDHNSLGYISIWVMCLGFLSAVVQLFPSSDNINDAFVAPIYAIKAIKNAFFVIPGNPKIYAAIALIVLATGILSIIKKPAALFVALLSYLGLFCIFVFKVPGELRHHGFILLILIFAMWIGRDYTNSNWLKLKNKLVRILLNINYTKISLVMINICLLTSLIFCAQKHYIENKYFFSGAKDMANFILKNKLDKHIIVAHRSPHASALLPYFPKKKFWYAGIEDYGTFITWNKIYADNTFMPNSEAIARMKKPFFDKSNILLLLNTPLSFPKQYDLKLIYKTDVPKFIWDETFYLYRPIKKL